MSGLSLTHYLVPNNSCMKTTLLIIAALIGLALLLYFLPQGIYLLFRAAAIGWSRGVELHKQSDDKRNKNSPK